MQTPLGLPPNMDTPFSVHYTLSALKSCAPKTADLLFGPCALAGLSIVHLALHAALSKKKESHELEEEHERGWRPKVAARGGCTGLALRALRLAGSVALLVLSAVRITSVKIDDQRQSEVEMIALMFYTSLLALAALLSASRTWRRLADAYLSATFVALLAVFVYLDLYPVARVGGGSPTAFASVRLALTVLVGLIVPLATPGPPSANPEESASLWSVLTWGYYDKIIWYAARHPEENLSTDKLPPLDSGDKVENLKKVHFKQIDPAMRSRKRYILWSLLAIFKWDCAIMSTLSILEMLANFIASVGINQILGYLERGSTASTFKPWVWVLWVGGGPVLRSVLDEWHNAFSCRLTVHASAIITQLVFEHSLRIRIGAEVKDADDSVDVADEAASEDRSTTAASSSSTPTPSAEDKQDEKKAAKQMMGKIMNLVTTDLSGIDVLRDWPDVIQMGLSCVVSVVFLYAMLGWSALLGTAVLVISLPIPAWNAKLMMTSQRKKMKVTDKRVQAVTQMMSVVRMIKLFGWEQKSIENLTTVRDEELSWVHYNRMLNLVNYATTTLLPLCNVIVTFGVYTLVMKRELTASRVFTSISVFSILQNQLSMLTQQIPTIIKGKVALDRIDAFLNKTELLHPPDEPSPPITGDTDVIGFHNASFLWNDPTNSQTGKGARAFKLTIDGTVTFERGTVNLIVGPTGSGKTSVLFALLGEMYNATEDPEGWYNLPRSGGVAYAAQETWVLNETIRENILFGSPLDEERYKKVLEQCALEQDLALFAAGDMTEVGEKGLTLSGGQKARVTLARAVYSRAEVLLLDDVLAALDVHTARWVVDKCFKGDLLQGRTILLVTHNLALTRAIARKLIHVDAMGRVTEESSIAHLIENDAQLATELAKEEEMVQRAEQEEKEEEENKGESKGKLTIAEDVAHGKVGLEAIKMYLGNLGGVVFWALIWCTVISQSGLSIVQPYWLGLWSNEYEVHKPSEVPAKRYLGGYALLVAAELFVGVASWATLSFGAMRASRKITKLLIGSIMASTFRWLDTVPVARVITRCTEDLASVDGSIPSLFLAMIHITVRLVAKLVAVVSAVGWKALVLGAVVLGLGYGLGHLYLVTQRAVKREQSVAKSPILSVFGAGIASLPSVRAYGAQDYFIKKLSTRIDVYTHLRKNFFNISRWVGIRIDALGGLFAALVAAGVIYGNVLTVGNAGFALSQVLGFADLVFSFVRFSSYLEIQCNSLERIRDFVEIEHEPAPTPEGQPPAYWPASGNLRAEKLSARYGPDSPNVLTDVTFEIKSGERVGVVGRTGAGKSTFGLALLRALFTSGQVFYDGIDIQKINLDALRANITLIPQNPELLAGTLRENLDPFGEHDDATLNDALRCAGLFRLQQEGDRRAIPLDSEVEGGGANFSHGQRQIIALARAQVRRSKLMIMDEATASIDYETDTAIQESIRTTLGDVTIITIAHRLQTIMDSDKIIVLDSGKLAEFGSPRELLAPKKGLFYELVERSHDKDALYKLVK